MLELNVKMSGISLMRHNVHVSYNDDSSGFLVFDESREPSDCHD